MATTCIQQMQAPERHTLNRKRREGSVYSVYIVHTSGCSSTQQTRGAGGTICMFLYTRALSHPALDRWQGSEQSCVGVRVCVGEAAGVWLSS